MKRPIATVLLILLPVVFLFGVLEGVARVVELWRPTMHVDISQGFGDDSFLFAPMADGILETHPDKRVSFPTQRLAMPKPAGTFRIFALGGSSVNYLDYEFSQLETALETVWASEVDTVEVINCGGLSYGSHRLVLIAAEILQYDPDLVLLYSGHNEFEEIQQLHLANLPLATAQDALSRLALFRRLRDMRAQHRIAALVQARDHRELAVSIPEASKAWLHEFTEEEIATRMNAFRDNLAAIVGLCRARDVPIIMGTVPSNLLRPNLPGDAGEQYEEVALLFAQGHYEEAAALGRTILRHATPRHQSSDAENDIIRDLAHTLDVPLADVEQAVINAEPNDIPGETLFNDHCHLNPDGNRILREVYQQVILDL